MMVVARMYRMSWMLSICFALVMAGFMIAQPARVAAADEDNVTMQVAQLAADLFVDGDFQALHTLFAPPIQEQVSASQIAAGVKQFGAVERVDGPAPLPNRPGHAVAVMHFETTTLDLLIAVEPPGWLMGFQLVPHNPANLGGLDLTERAGGDVPSEGRAQPGDPSAGEYVPPAYVNQDAFAEQDVTFGVPNWELPATYSYPVGRERFPAVVLVHGSGPHDRDATLGPNRPFRDLAWGLASQGIAVLRYDKRTLAYTYQVDAQHITPQQEVIDDAVAAVQWLKGQPGVGPVYVLGHSLGGMLAPAIALQAGDDVTGIVTLAGATRPLEDLILEQTEYLAGLDGEVNETEERQMRELRNAVVELKAGTMADMTILGGAPASYYKALGQLLPVPIAQQLEIPMLILQGGRDYQVTVKDFDIWQEGLSGHTDVTFQWFPKLNHIFMTGGTPPSPTDYMKPGHVAPDVIDTVATFIASAAHSM